MEVLMVDNARVDSDAGGTRRLLRDTKASILL